MKLAIRLAALVLIFSTVYLAAGATTENRAGYQWGQWPTVEMLRGLNTVNAPLWVQRIVGTGLGITGADIAYAEKNAVGQRPEQVRWLAVMHESETTGLAVALGVTSIVALLFALSSIWKALRARTKARRELARKTVERAFTEARRLQIQLAEVPLPEKSVCRGIMLPGAPGSGKTEAVKAIALGARIRNDTLVCIDRGGELTQLLFKTGDSICCPLDLRSMLISLLAEINSDIDRDTVGDLLFPQRGDGSVGDFFQAAAAVVFKSVLEVCADADNRTVWQTISNKRELVMAVKGTAAEQYVEAREWGGIFSNMMNSLQWLKYLPPKAGRNGNSIRGFIRESDKKPGRGLWVVVPKEAAAALNPFAALVVGLVAHEALSLPPSNTRRIWLFTDELGNLPMLSNFSTVMTEGRKHGLCPVSGIQSIAQPRKIYGRDGAQELMACFQNWLILRQADAESAEAMSKHIGDTEKREWHQNEGSSSGEGRNTNSRGRTEHVRIKRTVLPRELQELPDLHGYLCLSPYPPAAVRLPLIKLPAVASRFEPIAMSAEPAKAPAPIPQAPELDLGALSSEQELEH